MKEKKEVEKAIIPRHIAIIPDGNRRWAKSNGLNMIKGYSQGVKKIVDVSTWAKSFGVKTLTIWALSTENIKSRSKLELAILYRIYARAAKDPEILKLLKQNNARVKVVGNTDLLPKFLSRALNDLEKKTEEYKSFCINLLVGYGGKDDLLRAFNNLYNIVSTNKNIKIDENLVSANMYSSSINDPDLIIRTSGEMRLSGLLPWQSSYSELYFEDKYWPEFEKKDLEKAIETFSNRQRRFGK